MSYELLALLAIASVLFGIERRLAHISSQQDKLVNLLTIISRRYMHRD